MGNYNFVLPDKKLILGVGVHPVTLSQTMEGIAAWIASARHRLRSADLLTRVVVTLNVEILYQAQTDAVLLELLQEADLVVPDGHGVVWAGRRCGHQLPERVTGIDLLQALATQGAEHHWRIYLLGSSPGVAARAGSNLSRGYPGLEIAGSDHGYFSEAEEEAVVKRIKEASADILFVGLGSPKQEFFIRRHDHELGSTVAIGVGGSFDVLAGLLKRAPRIYQMLHIEWVYRVIQEPARWRRIMVLPLFVLRVLFSNQ
jgi:N-acetylglucosaminyldiphosphoundecaprenol N-acetyl-beta-D-mannosaminyltransferase